MIDALNDAYEEFRRVDHLIHVSLKYTRTVDVLISVLKRLISTIDFSMEALLLKAKEEKRQFEMPDSPLKKAKLVKELYNDQAITDMLENYLLYRRLVRAEYTKSNEFRRHVTMSAEDNGILVNIDIDKVMEYFDQTKKYLRQVHDIIER